MGGKELETLKEDDTSQYLNPCLISNTPSPSLARASINEMLCKSAVVNIVWWVEGEIISDTGSKILKKSLEITFMQFVKNSIAIIPFQNRKRSPYKVPSLFKRRC